MKTGLNVEVVAVADPFEPLKVVVANGQVDAWFDLLLLVSLLHELVKLCLAHNPTTCTALPSLAR